MEKNAVLLHCCQFSTTLNQTLQQQQGIVHHEEGLSIQTLILTLSSKALAQDEGTHVVMHML
jgi:hypothetical protein